jgi:DtxR family transcriptional regulator, Mn-dependent transcriptional regulator
MTAHSRSVEDFLKAVYSIQQSSVERASTNALAEALNILPPSVTDMARRMADAGFVDYRRYYGVKLTEDGRRLALRVIRRHRLIELYLVEHLGYALHEVHDEAERLEHAVSDRFVDAIETRLGNPTVDPHGDPIPTADGEITVPKLTPLSELKIGDKARVSRYRAMNDDMLQFILERGFTLGTEVLIKAKDPFEGPITAQLDAQEQVIGHGIAYAILVEPL